MKSGSSVPQEGMKVAGRRKVGLTTPEDADRLLRTAWAVRFRTTARVRPDFNRSYSFLWVRNDYEQRIAVMVKRILEQEREKSVFYPTLLKRLFNAKAHRNANQEVRERQDRFLHKLIRDQNDDAVIMNLLFSVIAHFPPERSRLFVAQFLEHNKSLEAIQKLPLTPRSLGPRGSGASVYQEWADYYFESLLPLFNTVELLQHRQYMERRVQELRAQIEVEKKRDFMRD